MKFIRVIEKSSKAEIYININHIICFAKQDEETISIGVRDFDKPLIVDFDINDFKDRIYFLNKNTKDGII